ncbi:MAG: SDR family oxidoreductase, partial [Pseudomonadota bacterium]
MQNPFSLTGKTALVTGAGRGLGRAIAVALHGAGAEVIAVARTQADLDQLAGVLGARLTPLVGDVTKDAFIDAVAGQAQLDILVNNAGANRPEPFQDVSRENLDFILDLNVRSMFLTAQAAAAVMTKGDGG